MTSTETRGRARISGQRTIAKGYREIQLKYIDGSPEEIPQPGTFFTILPSSHPFQVMRRPFAYSAADAEGFSFVYEERGRATADLAVLPDGAVIDWLGPLGTGFPNKAAGDNRPVLVAGGIGVGPIYYLAEYFAAIERKPLVVMGARTAALVPELAWSKGVELRICTDDGSTGVHGNAMAALSEADTEDAEFYTCGPHPMMRAVHGLASAAGCSCFVSMEEMMACGVGACQGCAVEMVERGADGGATYKRACVEGPVFDSAEVAW